MLTLKSRFKDYRAFINNASPCDSMISVFNAIIKEKGITDEMTIDEAYNILDKDDRVPEFWITWTMNIFGKELASEVRLRLLGKIKTPMVAFEIYTRHDYLTAESDALLKSKFEGKLPTAEKELSDGRVKRTKA